jgi:hypothetical protein
MDVNIAKKIARDHVLKSIDVVLIEDGSNISLYGYTPEKDYLFLVPNGSTLIGCSYYIAASKETGKVVAEGWVGE